MKGRASLSTEVNAIPGSFLNRWPLNCQIFCTAVLLIAHLPPATQLIVKLAVLAGAASLPSVEKSIPQAATSTTARHTPREDGRDKKSFINPSIDTSVQGYESMIGSPTSLLTFETDFAPITHLVSVMI